MTARNRLRPEVAESWQAKVLEEVGRGGMRPFTCAIIAALGYNNRTRYPRMAEKAYIAGDGMVLSWYKVSPMAAVQTFVLGTTVSFTGDLRLVADRCKLTDADRIAFFDKMKAWIVKDERVVPVTQETYKT